MSKLKILFLTSSMGGGGAERVAALLSNAWAGQGHQVELVPTYSMESECVYTLDDKVRLTFLFDLIKGQKGRGARLGVLRSLIRSSAPDVVVSFLTNVNCAAILASRGLGVPVIACERNYPPAAERTLPVSYRILCRLLYRFATALTGQTEPASDWLRRYAGRAIVATIPNPVSLPLRITEPVRRPDSLVADDQKLLLWAGRLEDQKRPELAIKAFARIAASMPDWNLVMLGDGALRNPLEALVARHGLSHRIHMPGFVGNASDWYRRADLFVMTSSFEGFPNVLIEAMAHGAPAVAFDVLTGPRDVSDNGRRLMLLPDDDHIDRLETALRSLASSEEERHRLGEAGREVADAYSEDRILAMWDELFVRCVTAYRPETRAHPQP